MLRKLTKENSHELQGKKIICCTLNRKLIGELMDGYGICVDVVTEENHRKFGKREIGGREAQVCGLDFTQNLSGNDYAYVVTDEFYEEAYGKIEKYCGGFETVYYFLDEAMELAESYRDAYAGRELEDIIVFRSGPAEYVDGADFNDNSRALFEYMVENGYNGKYRLVWLVKDPEKYGAYAELPNVEFLSYDWAYCSDREKMDRYYTVMSLAKFFFTTDAYGFMRNARKDQVRVQLWHGCGFKTRVNFSRLEKKFEYTTVISELYREVHARIYGLRDDQILISGYAKDDWLFRPYEKSVPELFGMKKTSKVIFWTPTFRVSEKEFAVMNEFVKNPETDLPIVQSYEQLEQLDALLAREDVLLVIKLHFLQKKTKLKDRKFSNILILDNVDITSRDLMIQRLLASSDGLISDYSSIAVGYMLRDRPMAFTLDDIEEYETSRGFVFDRIRDYLPGKEVFTFDDFCGFIRETARGEDPLREKRHALLKKMHRYTDGRSCQRILDMLGILFI